MKRWIRLTAPAIFAVAMAVPGAAHAQATKKQVQGYVAGGYVLSEGDTADYVNDGWEISGGVIWRPAAGTNFGIRFDAGWDWFDANNKTVDIAQAAGLRVDDGNMYLGRLTLEGMYEFGGHGSVGGYIAAGFGGMHRHGELTTTVITGGVWCDPWTGWCYPGYFPGDAVVADQDTTKFTYSIAGGVTFPVGNGEVYVEARYHWMQIDDPSTQMLPILIGYRF
jgi:opacity protein-like surface antigen